MTEFPLMLAAGWIKRAADLPTYVKSAASAITVGSFTRRPREKNPQPNFVEMEPGKWINALSLPNDGAEYLKERLDVMLEMVGDEKHLRVSIAPINEGDLEYLTKIVAPYAERVTLEVNLACPNVWDGGVNKPLVCKNPEATRRALAEVECAAPTNLAIAVKLSPLRPLRHKMILNVCNEAGVDEIVETNTFPADAVDRDGKRVLSVPRGGLSGPFIHQLAVAQVRETREHLDDIGSGMRLVGSGGVVSARNVVRFREAGADAVQIGTHAFIHGPRVFEEILLAMP